MGQVLHGSAKTTHAVRALMQRSKPHRQAHRVFTAELGKRDLYGAKFPNGHHGWWTGKTCRHAVLAMTSRAHIAKHLPMAAQADRWIAGMRWLLP